MSEKLPSLVIVGRPNVGKSTLFNRLTGTRRSIVTNEPGITRDRIYGKAEWRGRNLEIVDTGGIIPDDKALIPQEILRQAHIAISKAALLVLVVDSQVGLTPMDEELARLLRTTGKPFVIAANKVDAVSQENNAGVFHSIGVPVFPIAAEHGTGVDDLLDAALAETENDAAATEDEKAPDTVEVAIIGRPNVGKSTLLNRMVGEDRSIVSPVPGTTMDTVDTEVEHDGHLYRFVDTAGIRRKAKVTKEDSEVESMSVLSSIRSIERAHIVVLLCDAEEGVAEQDAKILGLAEERGRAMIVALNKSDLLDKTAFAKAEENAREKLSFAPYVPVVRISAKTGRGVGELFATIDKVRDAFYRRVGTGELNRFFETVLDTKPPPTMGGRAPRLYYVTQAEVAPPTFIAMTNAPDSIHFSYRRFVLNQLRKHFGFDGVPVRVHYKARRRRGEAKGA